MCALKGSGVPSTKVVPRKPGEPFVSEDRLRNIRKDVVFTARNERI